VLFGRLPDQEVVEALPFAGDEPAVFVIRRLAHLIEDVPGDALSDLVADRLVRSEELVPHAGLELDDEDHPSLGLAVGVVHG
jgi:hypothetical protein